MKTKKSTVAAVLAALASSAFMGVAWAGKSAPREIDLAATQLEPEVIGIEVRDALGALKPPKKDEFEGAESFKARQKAFSETKFLGEMTPSSVIAMIAPAKNAGDVSYNYLADSGVLAVNAGPTSLSLIDFQRSWKWTIIENTTEKGGFSRRMNAYGSVVEVSKVNISIDGLAFVDGNLDMKPGQRQISYQLKVAPEEARDLAKNLAILYVGKLAPPYVVEYKTHESPTWSDPRELVMTHRAVVMDVAQLWIVNTRTGRVYHKANAPLSASYKPMDVLPVARQELGPR